LGEVKELDSFELVLKSWRITMKRRNAIEIVVMPGLDCLQSNVSNQLVGLRPVANLASVASSVSRIHATKAPNFRNTINNVWLEESSSALVSNGESANIGEQSPILQSDITGFLIAIAISVGEELNVKFVIELTSGHVIFHV
jgi:hypothetical protein